VAVLRERTVEISFESVVTSLAGHPARRGAGYGRFAQWCAILAAAALVGVTSASAHAVVLPVSVAALLLGVAIVANIRDRLAAVFTALLACMLVFGKPFSELAIGPAYVTELVMTAIGALLILGWLGGDAALRRLPRGPTLAVAAYLAAGVVAAAVGWASSDHYWLLRDSVLAGYALIVPVVIVLFPTRALVCRLERALFAAAIAGNIVWLAGVRYPAVAMGVYSGFAILPPIVRWACRERVPPWQHVVLLGALALQVSLATRAIWIALVAAGTALLLTRPARTADLKLVAVLAAAAVFALVAYALPHLNTQDNSVVRGAVGIVPGHTSVEAENSGWRLAFWKHDLRAVAQRPLTGVGFGPPADFCYVGNTYCDDTRTSRDANTVSGPHNSFVNILFRMGLLGGASLLALLGLGVRSVLRSIRAADREGRNADGAQARVVLTFFVYACVAASFSVALENPYIGLPFWTSVGLLFVAGIPHGAKGVRQASAPLRRTGLER
jgi:O-antigen ligase